MTAPEPDRRSAKIRLFVEGDLGPGQTVPLSAAQSHYLTHVMRRGAGDALGVFNGRDGEWLAQLRRAERNAVTLTLDRLLRAQHGEAGPWLAFAPVKKSATDFIVEKATELGAARLLPIMTRRTIAGRVKTDRLRAIAVEAAEQSERLSVPDVAEPVALADLVRAWPAPRPLLVADPHGGGRPVFDVLRDLSAGTDGGDGEATPPCFVVGPEGGLTSSDLDLLAVLPCAKPIRLGPRILRAETAALAALVCWQAIAGDWRGADPDASATPPSGAQ